MSSYLLKVLVVLLFSLLVVVSYYGGTAHSVNFNGYLSYILISGCIYGCYKIFQLISDSQKVSFTPLHILGYFLLHLFVLCGLFFEFSNANFGTGMILFFKILYFAALPLVVVFISLGFGRTILDFFFGKKSELGSYFSFIVSLGIGITLFISVFATLGFFGLYNTGALWLLLLFMIATSYKQTLGYFKSMGLYKINFQGHNLSSPEWIEKINPRLLSAEFFFVIISLVLSVSLISIMRPFPIGWDDLGAYMNYPRLMAASGEVGFLGSMMSWSVFTGIGYLFNNPVQAFFFNVVGGFLSVISLICITSDLLRSKVKQTLIHIPSLVAAIFISMPMVVFEQAKDMKIDPGLFFLSIIAVYILFKTLLNDYSRKHKIILYVIVGIILGFTFTIKFTSLLAIIGVLGVVFYRYLGWGALVGYFSLFIATFTGLGLWGHMNVIMPKDDSVFVGIVVSSSIIIALLGFVYAFQKYKQTYVKTLQYISIILIGVMIGVLPWVGNNIIKSEGIGVTQLLSGSPERFESDYSKIYTEIELEKIKQSQSSGRGLSSSGTTNNEDYGRYFGYEKGINNYVKLPWNLTMQVNQGGEFTDIGWLFLALIPGLFLFLPTRNKLLVITVSSILLLELLIFIIQPTGVWVTYMLGGVNLPFGYVLLMVFMALPIACIVYSLDIEKKYMKLFTYNLVFSALYMFLWSISSFGIVWYGIVMYFNMLLMISISLHYVSSYKTGDSPKKKTIKTLGTLTVFILIGIWFFNTVFAHSFQNLKKAGYLEFKRGNVTIVNAPFLYHPEYMSILYELNIGSAKFEDFLASNIDPVFLEKTPQIREGDIVDAINILRQIRSTKGMDVRLVDKAESSLSNIYKMILNPSEKFENTNNVYRVGTFLKYYITRNNSRLYEDSLLTLFDTYFVDDNIDTSVENMKKIDLSYLLVDLNAATIDNDPAKNLTQRVDTMFTTFTSSKLELIETDSICLKLGLDVNKQGGSMEDYLKVATPNHSSQGLSRIEKISTCHNVIYQIIEQNGVSSATYSYLLPAVNYIQREKLTGEAEIRAAISKRVSHGYKALFKIK